MTDIAPAASQHEILAVLARTLPAVHYLEVGVRDGCTLWVVAESAPKLRLAALCDTWGLRHGGTGRGGHDHIDRLLYAIGYYTRGGMVQWLDGRSQDHLPELLERPTRFELVHIDGDHDEQAAHEDIIYGWALLRPGGAMVVHDTEQPSVYNAITRFSNKTGIQADHHYGGRGTAVFYKEEER